jgi:hypothetical protein
VQKRLLCKGAVCQGNAFTTAWVREYQAFVLPKDVNRTLSKRRLSVWQWSEKREEASAVGSFWFCVQLAVDLVGASSVYAAGNV